MNLNTFDSLFEEFLKKTESSISGWKSAPVFKIAIPNYLDDILTIIQDSFIEDRLMLPFPSVKLIDEMHSTDGMQQSYFLKIHNGEFYIFSIQRAGEYAGCFCITLKPEELLKVVKSGGYLSEYKAGACLLKPKFKIVHVPFESQSKPVLCLIGSAAYFISMVNYPSHFITKVMPSEERSRGRSVEWVERKSHYIVLDNSHAESIRGGRKDFDGKITRAMHRRRGHTRLLRSDRFKNKKGSRIWVRSSWVGPEKWRGSDGSIYIIRNKDYLCANTPGK